MQTGDTKSITPTLKQEKRAGVIPGVSANELKGEKITGEKAR